VRRSRGGADRLDVFSQLGRRFAVLIGLAGCVNAARTRLRTLDAPFARV
jgi:hypothetical protein